MMIQGTVRRHLEDIEQRLVLLERQIRALEGMRPDPEPTLWRCPDFEREVEAPQPV